MHAPGTIVDIFLQPGDWHFGDRHTRIRTLLGSCVSITVWHPHRRIGGMCHYLLPMRQARGSQELSGRYADEALHLLLREIARAGTRPEDYELKLFGGGNMFPVSEEKRRDCGDVPCRNVTIGRELVARHGFTIKAEHLGGNGHRQIIFDIWSGDVWVKQHLRSGQPAGNPAPGA